MNFKTSTLLRLGLFCSLIFIISDVNGFQKATRQPLPNLDQRKPRSKELLDKEFGGARARLQKQLPDAQVDRDEITGNAKSVSVRNGFLSGKKGRGRGISSAVAAEFRQDEPHRATKAFLKEHRDLFGHGPEILENAKLRREFVTPHNGMRTVVWQQEFNGVPVYESTLISHTTKDEELVKISSHFSSDPAQAVMKGSRNLRERNGEPGISAPNAISIAAENVGDKVRAAEVASLIPAKTADKQQKFKAHPLKGETDAQLIWLPVNGKELRLCWQIVFTSAVRGELFKTLVDAQTGEILVRHCLTENISDASYRVYTGDSPTPFSPGHFTPSSTQPSIVSRELVVTNAYNTNASPNGWINDGVNETKGNNVEAHLDSNADDSPDLPRPQGSPFRVFDFPLDLTQAPSTYKEASVVQLFFLCNWYHDKLYELGFNEAAGNFQVDNFGRGGLGNDPILADAQDGQGVNNAQFSTPPGDGSSGRMEMFLFTTPAPDRDGSFDAEIVFHEYTHGLSNRRVGGGAGLSALQSRGMGEGWSDFYGLCLLADSADDVNANYAAGAYVAYQFGGTTDNYYYGIRRYPYSTDLTKNPLTFKDIDPGQASSHSTVPSSFSGSADQVHNQGEVWCSALWEIRANLINKHGFAIGNQLVLELVTDGMNLSPANPNFVQARDGILQADQINNAGANQSELWAGFAKRGLGAFATSPASSTTAGVVESFSLPDDLLISPDGTFTSSGRVGGPFSPGTNVFTLTNSGISPIDWTINPPPDWLTFSTANGTLSPGGAATTVTATINAAASELPMGIHTHKASFTNLTSGVVHTRHFVLRVGLPDFFTEFFENSDNDLDNQTFTFTPNGSTDFYSVCKTAASTFPTDPAGGNNLTMTDDSFTTITLPGDTRVKIYGSSNNVFYIGSNGYITLDTGNVTYTPSLTTHFDRARISALFHDFVPDPGQVNWKQMSNRVVVTYSNVKQYETSRVNTFQVEMFFDGVIRITYLQIESIGGIAGLSRGTGVPINYAESDFTFYDVCLADPVILNAFSADGNLTFEFNTAAGTTYEVQYSDNLIDWTPVAPTISGTGSILQWAETSLPPPIDGDRFFRIVTQ